MKLVDKVLVVGAGAWGTTVANLLAAKKLDVSIWAREEDLMESIAKTHENSKYLPGFALNSNLQVSKSLHNAMVNSDLIILAIPTQSLREIVKVIQPSLNSKQILLNLAKGIEEGGGLRCSEIIAQEIGMNNPIAVLSGPNIAFEVINNIPSKAVISCNNYRYLSMLKEIFTTPNFKVYENPDLVGTELGGALKNVIAIMAGIGDGLGFGANTKSAILTRGLREMTKIGTLMGANPDTFFGLSGLGDLMTTCISEHSRNRMLGENLGKGHSLQKAEEMLKGRVAEGIKTTKALFEIKSKMQIEMVIVDKLYDVLYQNLDPRDAYLAIWNPGSERELG